MKFDLQDALIVVGIGSIVGGVAAWSLPAASIVFGVIALAAACRMVPVKPAQPSELAGE